MRSNEYKLLTLNQDLLRRLLAKIFISTRGCWIWTGAKTSTAGYGVISLNDEMKYVHRLSMSLFNSEAFIESMDVLHSCDNKSCFNPSHLKSGTDSENMLEAVARGFNHNANKEYCPRGHKYTVENTYKAPNSRIRECRACKVIKESLRGPRKVN